MKTKKAKRTLKRMPNACPVCDQTGNTEVTAISWNNLGEQQIRKYQARCPRCVERDGTLVAVR